MGSDAQYYVYILASRKHGTLYIGVTNELLRRVHEHREGLLPGFTRRYGVNGLSTTKPTGTSAMPFTARRR